MRCRCRHRPTTVCKILCENGYQANNLPCTQSDLRQTLDDVLVEPLQLLPTRVGEAFKTPYFPSELTNHNSITTPRCFTTAVLLHCYSLMIKVQAPVVILSAYIHRYAIARNKSMRMRLPHRIGDRTEATAMRYWAAQMAARPL